jgi:DNA-directed RNA polymerase subunit L
MTYTVEQRGETQRLEALLRELRPIEARCLEFSDECLRAIERAKEVEDGDE